MSTKISANFRIRPHILLCLELISKCEDKTKTDIIEHAIIQHILSHKDDEPIVYELYYEIIQELATGVYNDKETEKILEKFKKK